MLVHARSLRDRAEALSHAAALAVIDAQTCANELMFLCAPSVRWEIDDAADETLRVLAECERAFGPAAADDASPPPPASPVDHGPEIEALRKRFIRAAEERDDLRRDAMEAAEASEAAERALDRGRVACG